jgi:hypothetical protein
MVKVGLERFGSLATVSQDRGKRLRALFDPSERSFWFHDLPTRKCWIHNVTRSSPEVPLQIPKALGLIRLRSTRLMWRLRAT